MQTHTYNNTTAIVFRPRRGAIMKQIPCWWNHLMECFFFWGFFETLFFSKEKKDFDHTWIQFWYFFSVCWTTKSHHSKLLKQASAAGGCDKSADKCLWSTEVRSRLLQKQEVRFYLCCKRRLLPRQTPGTTFSHCSPARARRRLSSPDVSTATWSRWRCYCRGEYKQMKKKKCLFLCRRSSLSERHQPCCDYHTKKNTRTRAWSTGADKNPVPALSAAWAL